MPAAKSKTQKLPKVTIKGARLLFRNFSGEQTPFNDKGKRNFNVVLDPDIAERLLADGWNVKQLRQRDEDEAPTSVLKVTVKFWPDKDASRQPRIVMVTSRGRTQLDDRACGALDYTMITNADLIISPFHWDLNGKQGVTAYLESLYATIYEDELELKYANIPEISGNPLSNGMITVSSEILAIERGNPDDETPF
jgi:hypothetical protein